MEEVINLESFLQVATLISAVATLIMAFLNWRVIKEMQKNRESENRPFVIVYLIQTEFLIHFVCKNIGKGMAGNIEVTFDKDLKDSLGKSIKDILFSKTIPDMPPQYKIETLLTGTVAACNREDKYETYTVNVKYDSELGHSYSENYHLVIVPNPDKQFILSNETKMANSLENIDKGINQLVKSLHDLGEKKL